MSEYQIGASIAAFAVATIGLWWFRLIMKNVREMPKTTRYGIYALVWLAYFVVVLLLVDRSAA